MSARKLTASHMAKVIRRTREGEVTDPTALKPDQMRLYSFYKPSLQANDYVIEVEQSVTAPTDKGTQTMNIINTRKDDTSGAIAPQEFEVIVPRFSLDSNLINSYYPPDGHQDEGRILPHIVLNDPHYPWEIPAGKTTNMDGKIDQQTLIDDKTGKPVLDPTTGKAKTIHRSMVPWVALIVFDPSELHLPTMNDFTNLNVPGYTQPKDLAKQNPKGTFSMKITEYFGIPESSRINYQAGYLNDLEGYNALKTMLGSVDVIFPTKVLFNTLFKTDDTSDNLGMEAHKYLAHVRHINTTGVPDAGIDEEGLFSIVMSSRTGALDPQQSHTQVCHLVSIEHVDSTLGSHLISADGKGSDRIGMVSLFSWIYTALPPNPVNFVDTMRNLTANQQMLRTDNNLLTQLHEAISNDGSLKSQAAKSLAARLKMGYTLARWRTQSGEESVAFNRGPLVPQPVTWEPAGDLPDSSNTSQEYQILDPETGIMDLSYSSAWQAGKLLAISDTVFSSALMRFRSVVHNSAANKTRMQANAMASKAALFSLLKQGGIVDSVQGMSTGQTGDAQRIRPPSTRTPAPSVNHPDVSPMMLENIKETVNIHAGSGQAIYDEFTLQGPNNNDWAIIHSWLCEKLSLGGIPPQYLIPEPSFLSPESLRFFYIDDFWLDCLLDGALSVANHLDADDDLVRREIKETFNIYLRTVVPDAGFKPQIPCYGFLIRSKLVKAMPDLRITVTWKPVNGDTTADIKTADNKPVGAKTTDGKTTDSNTSDPRYPVCRWTTWDEETLMCLLDRQPSELGSITLAQPPHQQRFSLGSHLDPTTGVTFDLRTLYTKGAPDDEWPEKRLDPRLPNQWIDIPSRCLKLAKMAKDINQNLQFGSLTDTQAYIDPTANSCELGLELNDPSYFFAVVPPTHVKVPQRDRQLYVRQPASPGPEKKDTASHGTQASIRSAIGSRPLLTAASEMAKPATPSTTAPIPETEPGPISKPPHQQTKMQPQPVSKIFTNPFHAASSSTPKSQFDLTIFRDYRGPPTRFTRGDKYDPDDYIPTDNIYFFDLIFSVRKKPTATGSESLLLKIDVDIPTATTPHPSKTTESLLTANYDGPGLRMLSNQRFIPFLFTPDDKSPTPFLHVELIPRSADDNFALQLDDDRSKELDFRLAEANISPMVVTQPVQLDPAPPDGLAVTREKVVVVMTEWYATAAFPKGEPVSSKYKVIKWKKQDDTL